MSKKKKKKKQKRAKHETTFVSLKRCHVDKGVASTVQWLNSFQGVYTLFSCEGYDSAKGSTARPPYVMFHCWDIYDLQKICEKIQRFPGFDYGTIVVENCFGHLRYILRFNSLESFADFKNSMGFFNEDSAANLIKALGWQEKKSQLKEERENNERPQETA